MMFDVVGIAEQEIGYKEQGNNLTKYGKWYGLDGAPWCMMFVQWCFAQAGYTLPFKTASCSDLVSKYKTYDMSRIVSDPQPGDIVIYTFGHCGIVCAKSGNSLVAIEGNTTKTNTGNQANGEGVYKRTRPVRYVSCFIRPVTKIEEEQKMKDDIIKGTLYIPASWSYDARVWNDEAQIFQGVTYSDMNWNGVLTREQAITALYRFYNYVRRTK